MKTVNLLGFLLFACTGTFAQHLKPGFDISEYIELLKVSARHGDTSYYRTMPAPEKYKFVYRSPIVGLDNQWDLWAGNDNTAVICIRGTTQTRISWMANFYSAMVPAKGELHLSKDESFHYELASDPKAAVHVGWLLAMAFLSKDILPKIDSCYKAGIKDFTIMGHSQGGGIAFLFTSYLHYLKKKNQIQQDIRFKTYCSAGPKPGNLFYAYDYEVITANGWGFNVVNTADWVPESPASIQTLTDFNELNPFVNLKTVVSKQRFPENILAKHAYNRMSKPSRRAQKNYQKYLGRIMSRSIVDHIPGYEPPKYYPSYNYVRAGTTIVMRGDEEYFRQYPEDNTKMFTHHLFAPYLYLAEKLKDQHN
jgi:hypothetical protein